MKWLPPMAYELQSMKTGDINIRILDIRRLSIKNLCTNYDEPYIYFYKIIFWNQKK